MHFFHHISGRKRRDESAQSYYSSYSVVVHTFAGTVADTWAGTSVGICAEDTSGTFVASTFVAAAFAVDTSGAGTPEDKFACASAAEEGTVAGFVSVLPGD